MISTDEMTSSKHTAIRLQLSDRDNICQRSTKVTQQPHPLTKDDVVDLSSDPEGGVVAAEDIDSMFGGRVCDRQILVPFLIFLRRERERERERESKLHIASKHISSCLLTTIHFFPCRAQTGGFLAAGALAALGAALAAGFSEAFTTEDARSSGFLCVFISSVTLRRPTHHHSTWTEIVGMPYWRGYL